MIARSDPALSRDILNFQYSVFFGVIVSFSFYLDSGKPPTVQFAISPDRAIAFGCFSIYYILDWFTNNVLEERGIRSPVHLFGRAVWVGFLGVVIVSLNGSGMWKLYLLAVYVLVAGFYDFWLMVRSVSDALGGWQLVGQLLAASRIAMSAVFVWPWFLSAVGRHDAVGRWELMLNLYVAIYVGLKALRLLYFLESSPNGQQYG